MPFAVDPARSAQLSLAWENDVAVLFDPDSLESCAVVTFPLTGVEDIIGRNSIKKMRSTVVDVDCPLKLYRGRYTVDSNGYLSLLHHKILDLNSTHGMSVDHIDRIRIDNRRKNLREATRTEQSVNRCERFNRNGLEGMCVTLGIQEMPRYFRWDDVEDKFTFKDHPFVKAATQHGIPVNPSGTKAKCVSLVNKFRSCLLVALEVFEKLERQHGIVVTDDLHDERFILAAEYNDAVRKAHLYRPEIFPDGPYADMSSYEASSWRSPEAIRAVLSSLPPLLPGEKMGGPQCLGSDMFHMDDLCAVACFKGDISSPPIVWDSVHHDTFKDLTIDRSDLRIHLTTELREEWGLPTSTKKIFAFELIYHVLERNPSRLGFVIVPYNHIKRDMRVANMRYIRGEPKNFRPATPVPEPSPVNVGFSFLPRGVSVFVPDPQTQSDRFEFHVRPSTSFLRTDGTPPPTAANNKPKKIVAYKNDSKRIFEERVLPLLTEADPDFPQKNAEYQKLLDEYHLLAAAAAATAI